MTDTDTAERRGRMMTTRTVTLTLEELGALLAAAAHHPDTDPTEPGTVTARLWSDLAAVDPDAAHEAWRTATDYDAPPRSVVNIAACITGGAIQQKADER